MRDDAPLVIKLEKNRQKSKDLGAGIETAIGQKIKSYMSTVDGLTPTPYAEKPFEEAEAAAETIKMYQLMKAANLPVVSFLKIVRKRDLASGVNKTFAAMEDLSEHGENIVVKLGGSFQQENGAWSSTYDLIRGATNMSKTIDQLVKALAVLHNNKIYEFHDTCSFFIIVKKSATEGSNDYEVDFKILDYSNFTTEGSKQDSRETENTPSSIGFYNGTKRSLAWFVSSLSSSFRMADMIEKSYLEYRAQEIKTYS